MKKVLSLVAFLALSACGLANDSAVSSAVKRSADFEGKFVFNSETTQNEISVLKNKIAGYTITQTTSVNSRGIVRQRLDQAVCVAKNHPMSGQLRELKCYRDHRGTRGSLFEVVFTRQANNLFTATYIITPSSTDDQPADPIAEVIGENLEYVKIAIK